MATDKNIHLQKVLDTHNIEKLPELPTYISKKNKVKQALSARFASEKASEPIDSGSYAKGTSINTKFDIDCCIPFKKKISDSDQGFRSLEEMYDAVHDYLRNEYVDEDDDIVKEDVRKQKVSIGMKFKFEDGDEFELDVVPGRERPNNGSYNDESTDLSLYIKPSQRTKKEEEDNKTRIRTNVKKHVELLKGESRKHERKIARLLKVWKTERKNKNGGKLIKSFVMEVYTRDAFDACNHLPSGLWEKTKMVMNYIIDRIESSKLEDPANSSNIISDSMSTTAKTDTRKTMEKTISDIDEDSDKIKDYFPINDEYDNEEEDTSSSKSASYLSTNKFG